MDSKSKVWPITNGKLSTANAITANSKCINLQEKNKIILLEETLKPSQCFLCIFTLKGNKRTVEMLFKRRYQDSVITCQNNLIKIWNKKKEKKKTCFKLWLDHYISKVLEHVLWTPYESLSLKFLLQYKWMYLCSQQWQIWRHKKQPGNAWKLQNTMCKKIFKWILSNLMSLNVCDNSQLKIVIKH